MNRQELAAWLTDTYSVAGEYLFTRYPSFQVFRHHGSRKWFAVIMDIPGKNLGLAGDEEISVVNLKCDTRLIGSFREEPGVEDEKLKFLADMSHALTNGRGFTV